MGKSKEDDSPEKRAASIANEADRARALRSVAETYCRAYDFPGALDVAATISLPRERAQALLAIAMGFLQAKKRKSALQTFGEIETLLAGDGGGRIALWERAELLGELGKLLADAGEAKRASAAWSEAVALGRQGEADPSPDESLEASSVLWGITEAMAKAGEIDEAERVASSIRNPRQRTRALEGIARLRRG